MMFLSPFGFWFLAGIPVIVLLYLRRIQRKPMQVSTLLFWQRVMENRRPRALFQKLRQLLSLLLHLLIFLLIAAALARPVLSHFATTSASTILVLDTRARMQAKEPDGSTRFAKAVQMATTFAHSIGGNQEMALILADRSPEVAVPFTTDENEIEKALQEAHATDAAGTLEPAIKLASQLLATRGVTGRAIVLTDSPEALPYLPPNVHIVAAGSALDNVAITQFSARPLPDSPQTSAVFLELANFGTKSATGNVEISLDGGLIEVKPYRLAPGERSRTSFTAVPSNALNARGWLIAKLDKHDALPLDDIAFAALPSNATRKVLLVTKGNLFLEKALETNGLLQCELLSPDQYRDDMAASFDAVIFDDFVPVNFSLAKANGNFLFIHRTPFAQNGELNLPLVSDADSANPLLRLADFNRVSFLRAASLEEPAAKDGWSFQSPLKAFEHPLIITGTRTREGAPAQHLAAFAFDVGQTDLPLRVAFPLLINNTLHWLSGGDELLNASIAAGETLNLQAGEKIWNTPQQDISPVPENPSPLVQHAFQPLRNGYYLEQTASALQWLAVNTFSDAESNLRAAKKDESTAPVGNVAGVWWRWPLWIYLALAAFVLFTIEWWLYHQRTTE